MSMFGYYALHSFKNQIRKLLKTWVIIFILLCALLGGGLGVFAGVLSDEVDEQSSTEEIAEEEMEEDEAPSFFEEQGVEKSQMLELLVGAVALLLLVYQSLSADKNGSKIFLPADVNLLFASPMRPQSVLMFRLASQMGLAVLLALYMLIQIPNIISIFDMSVPGAAAVLLDFGFAFGLASLIKVLLYLHCARSTAFKKNLSYVIYGLLALAAACFFLFWKHRGGNVLPAAVAFFNAPVTRWIPIWGWLKGFPMWADAGNLPLCLLTFALMLLGCAALLWIIRRTEADFYEDAMAKSEETAALLERAKAEQSGRVGMKQRRKDRGDSVRRDGFTRGAGAGMFFYKTMYNRTRFARFGFFTKTTITYLAAGLAAAAFTRFFLQSETIYVLALGIAVLVFFRALGNPLEQDVKMGYFIMIPESARKKLAWSLLGSTVCCLLDCLPGLILGALLLGGGDFLLMAKVLGFLPLILSLDLFSTIVGTFIDLSVPITAGTMVKQIIQVIFIYFGLVPDAIVLSLGLVFGYALPAIIGAVVLNLLLTLVFFLLAASYLEPYGGRTVILSSERTGDAKEAKKVFSRLGFAASALLIVSSALQLILIYCIPGIAALLETSETSYWLCTFVPIYCVGVPIALLILRGIPSAPPEKTALRPASFVKILLVSVFAMIAGNLLGTVITALLQASAGLASTNAVLNYAMSESLVLKIFFMVLCAPVIEEYIFRKRMIDAMRPYGGALAVLTSAAIFGLFHGNLSQLFYAFALGAVFGYVYLRTGKLRYTIALHIFINFLGSVIGPWVSEYAVGGTQLETILLYCYVVLLYGCAAAGLVIFLLHRRGIVFSAGEKELPKRKRFSSAWVNPGMILLTVSCLALIIVSLFA